MNSKNRLETKKSSIAIAAAVFLALGEAVVQAGPTWTVNYNSPTYDTGVPMLPNPVINNTATPWTFPQVNDTVVSVSYSITTHLWMTGEVLSADGIQRTVTVESQAQFSVTLGGGSTVNSGLAAIVNSLTLGPGTTPQPYSNDVGANQPTVNDPNLAAYEGVGTVQVFVLASMLNQAPGPAFHNQTQAGSDSPFAFVNQAKARFVDGTLFYRLSTEMSVAITFIPEPSTWAAPVGLLALLAWQRLRRRP